MSEEDIQKTVVLEDDKTMIREKMHEFYELLPYPEVSAFDLSKVSPEALAAFKAVIDQAQEKAEEVEAMRLRVNYQFTRENLEKIGSKENGYKTLQKIAMTNGVKATGSGKALIESLLKAGAHKSIEPRYQVKEVFGRLAFARNQAAYLHPRQIAARENNPGQ